MTRDEAKQLLRARDALMEIDPHYFCDSPVCNRCDLAARRLVGFHLAEQKRGMK